MPILAPALALGAGGRMKPPAVPVSTGQPQITSSGDVNSPVVTDTLNCSNGSWSGNPNSFAFQWCYVNNNTVTLGSSSSYTVQTGDVGQSIVCLVTASNAGGASAPAEASETGTVGALPSPVNTVTPNVTSIGDISNPADGDTLSCDGGSWNYSAGLSYQWNNSNGQIDGATGSSYTVDSDDDADAGTQIFCTVTATNTSGSSQANSNSTGTVQD